MYKMHFTALILTSMSVTGGSTNNRALIDKSDAIDVALREVGVEVLGVRFDEPDTQWDVFVRSGDRAYEVEVDARSGEIIAVEEEDLEEIQAELSGDLSHEGVDGDVN